MPASHIPPPHPSSLYWHSPLLSLIGGCIVGRASEVLCGVKLDQKALSPSLSLPLLWHISEHSVFKRPAFMNWSVFVNVPEWPPRREESHVFDVSRRNVVVIHNRLGFMRAAASAQRHSLPLFHSPPLSLSLSLLSPQCITVYYSHVIMGLPLH